MSASARSRDDERRRRVHPVVFPVSAGLIVLFAVVGALFVERTDAALGATLGWITGNLGWFFILAVAVFLILCAWLVLGPYARIRLGPDDSRPDYSTVTWFAMLFSAGMGIGLLFWGVAEPISHYAAAPRVDSQTPEAAADAMLLTFHHWGLGPWAVYAVLGLALAYFGFRHDLPLTVRSVLHPLIGDRIHGPWGNLVDILAVLGTMFGIATSLGLGVMQVNAGLTSVAGVPSGVGVQILLIAGITLLASVSVFIGLDRGIRRLSQINVIAASVLLAFVALAGPTALLLAAYVENVGQYVVNSLDVLFWSGAYDPEAGDWLGGWTIFYWAWWISWSPFVGTFIARISRGRTIREFVLGVLLVPSLVSFLWFTVMGNTALELERTGAADIAGPTAEDSSLALFALLESLPLAALSSVLAILVVVTFFVTSSDSGSYVINMITSGGALDTPRSQRVFWAISEGVVAAVLLAAGGLAALQAGAVSTGLPFTVVLLVVVVALVKALRQEPVVPPRRPERRAPSADTTGTAGDPTAKAAPGVSSGPSDEPPTVIVVPNAEAEPR